MKIKSIENEEDYKLALERLQAIFDAKEDSPEEEEELFALVSLIEKYEDADFKRSSSGLKKIISTNELPVNLDEQDDLKESLDKKLF